MTEIEEEKIKESSWPERLFRALGALVLIAGLLYLSGVYQFFFYQRTPATVEQLPLSSEFADEIIAVPLAVIVFTAEFGGSVRDRANIERLTANASRIWEQAAVALKVVRFERIYLDADELRSLRRDPVGYLESLPAVPGTVRAFFVHDLAGINGIAYGPAAGGTGGRGTIAVADHTSVFDFRVLAHEIGHVLGLGHVSDPRRLMFSGANGTELSLEEINQARAAAQIIRPGS